MFSCCSVLVVLLLGLLGVSQVSSAVCTDKPVFTPSKLVVQINHSIQARCDVCESECHGQLNGLEISVGNKSQTTGNDVWLWTVERLTEWDIEPMCFYNKEDGNQCVTNLPVTVYQPPQSVRFRFLSDTELLKSGNLYILLCSVSEVAPLRNLVVTFHRGLTTLGQNNSSNGKKTPTNINFTLSYRPSKEDNGAEFWCEAKLELGPGGPQPPPMLKSQKVTAEVSYGPELLVSANPDPIQITEGNPLYLNCSAEGNPAPSYTWTLPSGSSSHNGSVFTVKPVRFEHDGVYNCSVSNTVGNVEVKFNVHVKVDRQLCHIQYGGLSDEPQRASPLNEASTKLPHQFSVVNALADDNSQSVMEKANPIVYIVAGVGAGVVLICVGLLLLYIFYYKPNRMGQYTLKDVFRLRTQHTAVPPRD